MSSNGSCISSSAQSTRRSRVFPRAMALTFLNPYSFNMGTLCLVVRSAVLALDLADADHPMRIPDFPPFDLRGLVHRILGPGLDRFQIAPVDRRHARAIPVARALDAKKAGKRLGML